MTAMTPEEASKQTCPLIRYCINPHAVMQDGAAAIHEHQPCQGPACKVGWRWMLDGPTPGSINNDHRGYCGAFGRPE
jgi:hypothetical protein